MIEIKKNDYILGFWYAERRSFGNVIIYVLRRNQEKTWRGIIRYRYYEIGTAFDNDDDKKSNNFTYDDIDHNKIIKYCNDKIDELGLFFRDRKDSLIVKGNIDNIIKMNKNDWLPSIVLEKKKPIF